MRCLSWKVFPPIASVLLLTACGGPDAEPTTEADVTDVSGGELIVTERTPGDVNVDTPDIPMMNVPPPMTEKPPEADLPPDGPGTTPATQ